MKKICIIGVGAFGFAILYHLAKNHPEQMFYAYEKDPFVLSYLKKYRANPHFFAGTYLPENVIFLDNLQKGVDFDMIFLSIPAQFIRAFLLENIANFKSGVILLNLSKGIDIESIQTPGDVLEKEFSHQSYTYAVLSGGMIARELIAGNTLGAQVACQNESVASELKYWFENENLHISISQDVKNTQLFGSLKNIFALYVGYLEGKGYEMSSISFYFCQLYKELPLLLENLGGQKDIDFSSFALGGDLLATCFGNSRNRYFGKLVGEGMSVCDVETQLKAEKKHAEGYYTLKSIGNIILQNPQLPYFQNIVKIFL